MIEIQQLNAEAAHNAIPELAEMLQASVAQGASIGFVMPFSLEQAQAFWRGLLPAIERGERLLLVAYDAGRLVGTVQLLLAMPDNGRHRAEVVKLMVHPDARRRGIARSLMLQVQQKAAELQRHLLVLDTLTGDTAEGMYRQMGFQLAGSIPQYALASNGSALDATSYMYKLLSFSPSSVGANTFAPTDAGAACVAPTRLGGEQDYCPFQALMACWRICSFCSGVSLL